jgi:hypothetical protein
VLISTGRKLADGFIEALAKSQMKSLIVDLEAHPAPNDAPDLLSFRQ